MIGTWYEEIIVERLFEGNTQLNTALQPMIAALNRFWNWTNTNESARLYGSIRVAVASRTSIGRWERLSGAYQGLFRGTS